MSTKAIALGALILGGAWLAPTAVAQSPVIQGQENPTPVQQAQPIIGWNGPAENQVIVEQAPSPQPKGPPATSSEIPAIVDQHGMPPGSVCSPWTGTNGGTDCCGPVGKNGPIQTELFLRNGIGLLVAGSTLKHTLNPSYVFSGGGRSLFFNCEGTSAWTVEYGVDYMYNNGNHPEQEFDVFGTFINIRDYNRGGVHLSAGKEWFWFDRAFQVGSNYRFGFDIGGKYGYSRVNFNLPDATQPRDAVPSTTHRGDVTGGPLVAIHSDVEIPMSTCLTLITGVRAEWSMTFTDIMPTEGSEKLQEVIISWNCGIRY